MRGRCWQNDAYLARKRNHFDTSGNICYPTSLVYYRLMKESLLPLFPSFSGTVNLQKILINLLRVEDIY